MTATTILLPRRGKKVILRIKQHVILSSCVVKQFLKTRKNAFNICDFIDFVSNPGGLFTTKLINKKIGIRWRLIVYIICEIRLN